LQGLNLRPATLSRGMKTLSLSRPLILMLVGLPGSGKSFFGRQFAEMFVAPLVSNDRLRYELFAQPAYSSDEQEVVQRVADYQIGELLKTHRSFVVDGGCGTKADRQKFEGWAKKHGYGTLLVWVQTDEQTCRQRSSKRNPRRSADDGYSPSMSESQWKELAKQFAQPTKEPYMVISGKHAFSTQAKMVLRKLASPHAEEATSAHETERGQANRTARRGDMPTPRAPERPNAPPRGRRSVLIT
jgi:predicted kinase